MNNIAIYTNRSSYFSEVDEVRDCIDLRFVEFIRELGLIPLGINNLKFEFEGKDHSVIKKLFEDLKPRVIFLSGGEDYGQNIKRDNLEFRIIHEATQMSVPVIGVCRGMQVINKFFNGENKTIEGHVRNEVMTLGEIQSSITCYHRLGVEKLGVNLVKTIWTIKNEIEGFKSLKFKILGLMMHPERQKNIDTYKNYVAEFLRQ